MTKVDSPQDHGPESESDQNPSHISKILPHVWRDDVRRPHAITTYGSTDIDLPGDDLLPDRGSEL